MSNNIEELKKILKNNEVSDLVEEYRLHLVKKPSKWDTFDGERVFVLASSRKHFTHCCEGFPGEPVYIANTSMKVRLVLTEDFELKVLV